MALGIGFAPGLSMAAKVTRIAVGLLAIVALLLASYCQGRSDGRTSEQLDVQRQINAALERDRKARDRADQQRQRDEQTRRQMEEDYEDAIEGAPGGANSPAAVALACERLRRAYPGRSELLPAECGRGGRDGAEAAPAG